MLNNPTLDKLRSLKLTGMVWPMSLQSNSKDQLMIWILKNGLVYWLSVSICYVTIEKWSED